MTSDALIELARAQGVGPVEDIRMLVADYWPPETDVDEFLARDASEDRAGCVLGLVLLAVAFIAGAAVGWWVGRV
jgi:hypothetical protein